MKVVTPEKAMTPVQMYRKDLVDYFDKNGYCHLPSWLIDYLPILGFEKTNYCFNIIEKYMNTIPVTDDEILITNSLMNMIMLLVRLKNNNIVII